MARNKPKNRTSPRLQRWDYGWAGAYFITICTKNRAFFFGDIGAGHMQLSSVGIIADILWHEIRHHAKDITLGDYIIMPNHVHGIIILEKSGPDARAPMQQTTSLSPRTIGQQRFQNQGKNTISSIVGSYKSAVTKHARRLGFEFGWQPRFHDHIIRNEAAFQTISRYIRNNPKKWPIDTFHPNNPAPPKW